MAERRGTKHVLDVISNFQLNMNKAWLTNIFLGQFLKVVNHHEPHTLQKIHTVHSAADNVVTCLANVALLCYALLILTWSTFTCTRLQYVRIYLTIFNTYGYTSIKYIILLSLTHRAKRLKQPVRLCRKIPVIMLNKVHGTLLQ